MEPNIKEGAFVGGKAFAAWIPYEGVTLKRVFVDPENNQFILRSRTQNTRTNASLSTTATT